MRAPPVTVGFPIEAFTTDTIARHSLKVALSSMIFWLVASRDLIALSKRVWESISEMYLVLGMVYLYWEGFTDRRSAYSFVRAEVKFCFADDEYGAMG